jgi:hypothetical protein
MGRKGGKEGGRSNRKRSNEGEGDGGKYERDKTQTYEHKNESDRKGTQHTSSDRAREYRRKREGMEAKRKHAY